MTETCGWAPANRTHEPLVDDEVFLATQHRLQAKAKPDNTRPRTANRRHPLSGRLSCGLCGFRMIADYRPPKSANGSPLIRYRCRLRSDRAVPEGLKGHPGKIYLHQDIVMASVDRWLASGLNDPAWIAAASGSDEAEAARIEALQGNLAALERKIANLVSAVEGSDDAPETLISQLSARSLEGDRLKSEITRLAARQAMAVEDVQELIDHVGGPAAALERATDDERPTCTRS